jgi:hypothetical protein
MIFVREVDESIIVVLLCYGIEHRGGISERTRNLNVP